MIRELCPVQTDWGFLLPEGYWHVLGGRQNLHKECLCFGHTDIFSICDSLSEKRPTRAKIRSFQVMLNCDTWQLARCALTSPLYSQRKNNSSRLLLGPGTLPTAAFREHNSEMFTVFALLLRWLARDFTKVTVRTGMGYKRNSRSLILLSLFLGFARKITNIITLI